MKPIFLLYITTIVLLFSTAGCEDVRKMVFPVETKIDPCDPLHNYYYNEQHFINRDFVKEDGTYDYQKLFEAKAIEYSPCNPLKKESK